MTAKLYPVTTETETREAIEAAREALKAHDTIVMPTDTVYGIAADAFSHQGVAKLLADKGRDRTMPPPVLIFDLAALAGVVDDVPDDIYDLGGRFWPGALTIILHSYPSLSWDLGETRGTVAVRVPDDEFALKLLTEHGPLAVSSANKTGQEAALDAQTALESLGEDVAVVIDGGARPKPLESEPNEDGVIVVTERESAPSTILDCTSFPYVVVREGAIPVEELREVVPTILTRAEADEQAARKAEEAGSASSESTSSERALDEQADLDEAYEQWDSTHTVSGEPARRASAPAAGSVAASLMGATSALSSAFSTSVDQERSRGYRDNTPKPVRADEPQTHPVPADTARALVFGESKIETATQGEAKPAETKTEAARTESEAKTEQKDMPENQL
ncbi:L-threonylcarbamoyladenylate synthase [Rothia mucilaginosa]|uniref:L-threonylcarbamoyladenylate synthase n=1 Tax=Rothia sp. RSM407 TaxID=3398581 RepID=UPI00244A8C3C|nr:L-threonylcarbamoyladenylate synthase [uncultured Rothia sp.]